MIIRTNSTFDKHFKKRIRNNQKLLKRFQERVGLFRSDPTDPLLKNHQLTGAMKNYRAFSITGDYRVVYERVSKDEVIFKDVGTHNQVY